MAYRLGRAWFGAGLAALLGGTMVALACGARSELNVEGEPNGQAGHTPDGGVDASHDADAADAPVDAPEDAPPDAPPECVDPLTTYIYVVSDGTELLAFKPQSNTFESRGFLFCPDAFNDTPFSMAVDRVGIAHVEYTNGRLYRVSTKDASCEATPFRVGQNGFFQFGMGFQRDPDKQGDTLYVAEISFQNPSLGLASIDLDTYELSYIGPFSQNPGNSVELTPTGDGPLNGYFLNTPGPGGTLVEIDTTDASIVSATPLTAGNNSSSLAVAWWGGVYYIFTGDGSTSTVTRYDPVSQQLGTVATYPNDLVGAGVSTCAPGSLP